MSPKPDPESISIAELDLDKVNLSEETNDSSTFSVDVPVFDPENDLHKPINVDINAIVEKLWNKRTESPIVPRADVSNLEKVKELSPPRNSMALDTVVEETTKLLTDYSRHIQHPGHFGFLAPQGLRTDPMGFAMTAATNQNIAMYSSSPIGATLEHTVTSWLCELIGYDMSKGPAGVLLSGGSSSNLTAVATALAHHFGPEYRGKGLGHYIQKTGKIPVMLCSEAAHFCFQRACGMLGVGVENCITIPSDENFSMRMDLLEEAIEKYQDRGIICIAATAGTTLTGGLDNLPAIAKICQDKNIWFHVDAAYGGSALMSPELKPLMKGMELADSVTMDLHKWFYMSLDCSAILYKDPYTVKSLFTDTSSSLKSLSLDKFANNGYLFFLLGPELSRRMRALPLFIAMRHYGIDKLGKNVLYNVQCAKYMSDLVRQDPELELVYQSKLSVSIFRMILPPGYKHKEETKSQNNDGDGTNETMITKDMIVDELNTYIRETVENEDKYFMSGANIQNRPVLRCCFVNYNTRTHHVEELLGMIKRIGNEWIQSHNVNETK